MAEKEKTASLLTEIGVEDLYDFLGVQPDSTEKEINKAYRKKALKYHPDKNPDDPNAAAMFQKLSRVLTVLTDPVARASYDRWVKAKNATRRRHEELDVKRRRFKEQLEQRESQQTTISDIMTEREAAANMQKEIERLREESQRRIAEQAELLRQQIARGVSPAEEEDEDVMPTLKVAWKAKKSDLTNGGYNQALLEGLFSSYGPLHHVLVSGKRRGKALVSFHSGHDAQSAVERETGMPACPLTVSWVCGQPRDGTHSTTEVGKEDGEGESSVCGAEGGGGEVESGRCDEGIGGGSGAGGTEGGGEGLDFESIVLMKLRQAEERKRQLLASANDDT